MPAYEADDSREPTVSEDSPQAHLAVSRGDQVAQLSSIAQQHRSICTSLAD